ncbi:MAG: SDR family oxidoreductase [Myxococcales bacterium]|jgi:NAD(P)-dependent dehydrogenase (short-subunit alcohol dehydrogenase family)|nr:SDR family oxidoreductase [Myxococcales bacterium]
MGRFDGKIVVITGGTTGIGLATARAFLGEGAQVVVTGRSRDTVDAAQKELGPSATVLVSDTSRLEDIDALAAHVARAHRRVDAVFVNAGIAKFAPLEASTPELFDAIFDVNVRGAYFAIQKLAPLVVDGGSIVLNTSVVDEMGFPATSIYAASKAALRSFARTLSAELAGRKIRVNAVSPGPIVTPIFGKLGLDAAALSDMERQMTESNPMKRFGRAEEVARAVLFFASAESSYTTGAELAVDGGLSNL